MIEASLTRSDKSLMAPPDTGIIFKLSLIIIIIIIIIIFIMIMIIIMIIIKIANQV